ncbi:MAG: hypothetical protein H7258_02665 [Ferruginibacter sp.]|nr:hypothetical protein [Ferruginibacter sp.]
MKYFSLLPVIALTMLILFGSNEAYGQAKQDSGCKKYHTGKFLYTDSANNLIRLHRKRKYQFEYNTVSGVWVNFRITWKSDCEYELQQVGTNSKALRKFNHGVLGTVITNATADEGYEYTCACKGSEMPAEPDFMKKVHRF